MFGQTVGVGAQCVPVRVERVFVCGSVFIRVDMRKCTSCGDH